VGVLEKHQSFKLDNKTGKFLREGEREKCVCMCVIEKWKICEVGFVLRKKESQG